jgi:hypothetical protein
VMAPHHRFGRADHQALRDAVEERLRDRTFATLWIRVVWGGRQDAAAEALTVQHSVEEMFKRWCVLQIAEAAAEKSRIGHGLSAATQVEMREASHAAADVVDALEKQLLTAGMDRVCDATTIHVSKTPVGDPKGKGGRDEEGQSLCRENGVLVFEDKQWQKAATVSGRAFHRSHWLKLPCASGKFF